MSEAQSRRVLLERVRELQGHLIAASFAIEKARAHHPDPDLKELLTEIEDLLSSHRSDITRKIAILAGRQAAEGCRL